MISTEQICRGAMKFVTRELVPQMSVWEGVALTAFAPAVIAAKVKKYTASNLLDGTGYVDGNNVDLDEAYKNFKNAAVGKWPMEIIGFKFTESDLDKLYNYIREG